MGAVVKTLRRSNSLFFFYRRSIFSTEGSFGNPITKALLPLARFSLIVPVFLKDKGKTRRKRPRLPDLPLSSHRAIQNKRFVQCDMH